MLEIFSKGFLVNKKQISTQNTAIIKNKTDSNFLRLKISDNNINKRKYNDYINDNTIQILNENHYKQSKVFDSDDFYCGVIIIIINLILTHHFENIQLFYIVKQNIKISKANNNLKKDNEKESDLKIFDVSKTNSKRISNCSRTKLFLNPFRINKKSYSNILSFMFFLIITISIGVINSKGLCGNFTNPNNVTECLPYSTDDYFCCLLKIQNSPSEFQTCYVVEKNTASSSVIQIGKMTYNIDCSGIPDFYKYFPFEEKFKPCSTSNPKSISTCTDFEGDDGKCCLGIIKTYPDIRKCYRSIGLTSNIINYTTSYGDEITLFCQENYISLLFLRNRLNLFFYIMIIYMFIIY